MKKFLSLALALVLVFAMAAPALAVESPVNVETPGATEIEVKATVKNGTDGTTSTVNKYYVVVSWTIENPTFTKAGESGTTYTWNGKDGKYDIASTDGSDAKSEKGSASITVTNRSDLSIKVSAAYTAKTGVTGTAWTNADGVKNIGIAAGISTGMTGAIADEAFPKETFSGDLTIDAATTNITGNDGDTVTIGTITITISAV